MDGPFELRLDVPFNKMEHSVVDRWQHGATGREVCHQANGSNSNNRESSVSGLCKEKFSSDARKSGESVWECEQVCVCVCVKERKKKRIY